MSVQDTSIRSYHSLKDLGQRQKAVYMVILRSGSVCNMDIAEELDLPINSITPRTNELVLRGYVKEDGKRLGPTGRTVIYWKIKKEEPRVDWEAIRAETIQQRDSYQQQEMSQVSLF